MDLELEHKDQRFRVQRSATMTEKVISMRRSGLTGPRDPSVPTVDPMTCRPKWKWPEEIKQASLCGGKCHPKMPTVLDDL